MLRFRYNLLSLVLGLLLLSDSGALAQTAKVAFVKHPERDRVYLTDGTTTTEVLTPQADLYGKSLSVLAVSKDAKSMLIAGRFFYKNPFTARPDSANAFVKVDSPFKPTKLSEVKVLKVVGQNFEPSPLGALSVDDKEWFAAWVTNAPGAPKFVLYHGNFDGTGTVDTVIMPSSKELVGGFHSSNIAVDYNAGAPTMIMVIVDKLTSSTEYSRFQLLRWQPRTQVGTEPFGVKSFEQQVVTKRPGVNPDSSFAFALKALPGEKAMLALTPNSNNDIRFFTFSTVATDVVNLQDAGVTLSRSVMGGDLDFFTGTGYGLTTLGKQEGNGSDISFSRGGDSLVFITHEWDEEQFGQRGQNSQIWVYDLKTGEGQMVYNDPAKIELQPILLTTAPPVPEKPGYISLDVTSLNFGSIFLNKDTTLQFTISNPSEKSVSVDAVTLSNNFYYTLVSNTLGTTPPYTLAAGASNTYDVKFAPGATEGVRDASITVRFAESIDSVRTIALTGTGKKEIVIPQEGVEEYSSHFIVTTNPNPAQGWTNINVTGSKRSLVSVEVRDLLGRMAFSAEPFWIDIGEAKAIHVDARTLGLPNGTYTIAVSAGGETVTRQLVIVK